MGDVETRTSDILLILHVHLLTETLILLGAAFLSFPFLCHFPEAEAGGRSQSRSRKVMERALKYYTKEDLASPKFSSFLFRQSEGDKKLEEKTEG